MSPVQFCPAVCTFQTETTYFIGPMVLAFICILLAVVILIKLKEKLWLIILSALFSMFFLLPIVGIQHEGGGCGSGCLKNSRTTTIQIWHWDKEPLSQETRYGW